MGEMGIAYRDNVAANYFVSTGGERQSWNNGRTYRNDGVDIYSKEPRTNYDDVYVGDMEADEWLQYTFRVSENGNFELSFKTAADASGKAAVEINGKRYPAFVVPNSGAQWTETSIKDIPLQKGENRLKFLVIDGGFQLEQIEINRQN